MYWQTAVLNANSGSIEVDEEAKKQDNDYGKVAKAVGELQREGVNVQPPLINTAEYSFIPDTDNNQIIYSIKAIRSLNEDTVHEIISKRPYTSFDDFYQRVYVDGDNLKAMAFVNLIKAGAFAEFGDTNNIMAQFIAREIKPKKKLNGQNMTSILRKGMLDKEEYTQYKEAFLLRNQLRKQVHKKVTNPKDTLLLVKNNQINQLTNLLGSAMIVSYSDSGEPIISQKEFDKEYKEFLQPFMDEVINSKEFIQQFNRIEFMDEWIKRTGGGNTRKWAMDALTYYPDEHELSDVNTERYGISDFYQLDANPEPVGFSKYKGREYPQYEIHDIMGTVIDKNNTKHTVTLLTPTGVVICKYFGGTYAHYNRTIKVKGKLVEDSWFKRGTLLVVSGFRRDDQFVVKKSKFQEHSTSQITEVKTGGELSLQTERYML